MRLLSQKEWENPKYKNEGILQINLGLSQMKLNSFFDEVFSHIFKVCTMKNYSHEIFGIAMTLFHYYTYFKSFSEYDRCEVAISCIYLACKIEFTYMNAEDARNICLEIKKNQTGKVTNISLDFTKFDVDLLTFIGYDMDIKTPYKYYKKFYYEKLELSIQQDKKTFEIGIKIINDTYRSNMVLFFHPKYIALGSIFLTLRLTKEEDNTNIREISKYDKSINIEILIMCIDSLIAMFENRLK